MWDCASKKEEQRQRECACVCVGVSDLCPHVWLSPPGQGITAQGGGHLTGHRWQRQTDRGGGDINTLINNYLYNDTGYSGVDGRGNCRTGGEKETGGGGGGREENGLEDLRRPGERVTEEVKEGGRIKGCERG